MIASLLTSNLAALLFTLLHGAPVQSITGSNAFAALSFSLVEQIGCSLVASSCYRL